MKKNGSKTESIPKIHKKLSHNHKIIILIITAVLLLAVSSLGVYYIVNKNNEIEKIKIAEEKTSKSLSDAESLVGSGKIEEAKVAYDTIINETTEPYLKSVYIATKGSMYFNDGDYEQALAVGLESEAIDQNEYTASFIAQVYKKMGNYKKAIEYYNKTISLVDKNKPAANDDIDYYKRVVKTLEGLVAKTEAEVLNDL